VKLGPEWRLAGGCLRKASALVEQDLPDQSARVALDLYYLHGVEQFAVEGYED